MSIFIRKKDWLEFTPEQLEEYKDRVFRYYKAEGFPYYSTNEEWRRNEFEKLKRYDYTQVINDEGIIRQTMHGLALAWSFHPHSFAVRCGKMRTPLEAFEDDDIFRKVISKRIQLGDNMSDAGIRKTLRTYSGTQGVSNFRPTAAAAIYNRYAKGGKVWDMSMGYGGRLLGAIIAGVDTYYGNEPCMATMKGNMGLGHFFAKGRMDYNYSIKGSEDGALYVEDESLDLCFTSPPYFDWEKYSDEPTQSYIKFPTQQEWTDGYLKRTLEHCYRYLKPNGKVIINIAETKNFPHLDELCEAVLNDVGFKEEDTLKLALSAFNVKGTFKYEPVLVYTK